MVPAEVAYAVQVLQLILQIAGAVSEAGKIAQRGLDVLQRGTPPTADEWNELNKQMTDLRDQLHSDDH